MLRDNDPVAERYGLTDRESLLAAAAEIEDEEIQPVVESVILELSTDYEALESEIEFLEDEIRSKRHSSSDTSIIRKACDNKKLLRDILLLHRQLIIDSDKYERLDSEEALGKKDDSLCQRVEEKYRRIQANAWNAALKNIETVFPSKVAEICLPESITVNIPSVKAVQREKKLRPHDANRIYLEATAAARNEALSLLAAAKMDDNPIDSEEMLRELTSMIEEACNLALAKMEYANDRLIRVPFTAKEIRENTENHKYLHFYDESGSSRRTVMAIQSDELESLREEYKVLAKESSDIYEFLSKGMYDMVLEKYAELHETEWVTEVIETRDDILSQVVESLKEKLKTIPVSLVLQDGREKQKTRGKANYIPPTPSHEILDDTIIVPSEMFGFGSTEARDIELNIHQVGKQRIGDAVCMQAKAKRIAEETFGQEKFSEIAVVSRRIKSAVEHSAAGQFGNMPLLRFRDENLYPYEIRCPKTAGSNAPRVYFIEIIPSNASAELAECMQDNNIDKVVAMVGASLKSSQVELLLLLTSNSRATLRNKRAGSI